MVNKKKYIILGVVLILLVSIAGTLAWYTYGTKKSSLVLVLGNTDELLITLSPYELSIVAAPVTSYTSMTDYVSVIATNSKCYDTGFSFYYDIESIDSALASTSMKYAVTRSTSKNGTYSLVSGGSGSFSGASAGSHKIILEETVPATTTYYYKIYTYLDGNVSGSSSLQNKKMKATIGADISHYTVTLDANGGSVGTSTMTVTYGGNYGNLPTPTWSGHTFKGWNGKNKFNKENYLLLSNYTISAGSYAGAQIPLAASTAYYVSVVRSNGFDGTGNGYLLVSNSSSINSNWTAIAHNTYPNTSMASFKYTTGNDGLLYIGRNSIDQTKLNTIWNNTNVQIEACSCKTEYEPYYVTSSTKVTQMKNHVLTAIWS